MKPPVGLHPWRFPRTSELDPLSSRRQCPAQFGEQLTVGFESDRHVLDGAAADDGTRDVSGVDRLAGNACARYSMLTTGAGENGTVEGDRQPPTFYEWHRRRQLKIAATVLALAGVIALFVLTRGPGLSGEWYDRQNRPIPNGEGSEPLVLDVFAGEQSHCGWGHILFMELSWPLGSTPGENGELRQYVRDRDPVGFPGVEQFVEDARLPWDAFDTGWHRGEWRLWISPSQIDDYIYVVNEDRVEGWGRAARPIYCA